MEPGIFFYNGELSSKFKMHFQTRPIRKRPDKVIDLVTIGGRSGSRVVKRKSRPRLENITLKADLFFIDTKAPNPSTIEAASEMFFVDDYQDLILYYDDEFIYRAIVLKQPEFSTNIWMDGVHVFPVEFSLFPYKYMVDGRNEKTIGVEPLTLINPTDTLCWPTFKFEATAGEKITVTLDGRSYTFTAIDNGALIVDTDNRTVTNGTLEGFEFPYMEKMGTYEVSATKEGIFIPNYRTVVI